MFDQNGDGSISTDELKSVLESMGLDASDESIREMLHEAGCSEKDSLDYPDFLTMMTRKAAEQDLNKEIKDVRFRVEFLKVLSIYQKADLWFHAR